MPLSLTRPTKTDTSALLRSLILLSTSRTKRELEMPATMLPSFCTPRDSKISPSSTESETSSESTELLSDSTMALDSSTLTCSTTPHGLFSLLTRNPLSKKSEVKMQEMNSHLSLTQESISLSKRVKLPSSRTLENGLSNTLLNTMSSLKTCLCLSTRPRHKRETSMF